jgi:Mg-chelatase subunit ChlD
LSRTNIRDCRWHASQLGGGTNITKALGYAYGLVRQPARSIVVLITDFFRRRR